MYTFHTDIKILEIQRSKRISYVNLPRADRKTSYEQPQVYLNVEKFYACLTSSSAILGLCCRI